MIRLIQRRLIIPRGDTGSFSVPILGTMSETDIAVFSIFDQRIRKIIFSKYADLEENNLKIDFSHMDTVNLKPGKYVWDIKIYKNPQFIDDNLIGGDEINSYYAGFSLPVCEVKETADTYLCGKNNNVLFPDKINFINETLNEVKEIAAQVVETSKHYPIIQNNYWYIWSTEQQGYINTGIKANGDNNVTSIEVIDEDTLKVIFSNGGFQYIPISGAELLTPENLIYDAGSIDGNNDLIYDGGSIDNQYDPDKDLILDAGTLEGGD